MTNWTNIKARWPIGVAVVMLGLAAAKYPRAPGNPIPIRFTLEAPGYVTLVVEDAAGQRIENLVAGEYFSAGAHAVEWDGYDLGRAVNYSRLGVGKHYDVQRQPADPGTYRVRGLVHRGITLRYEMPVQSPGTPPWRTTDGSGAWLADHTPPMDVLSLPEGSPFGSQPQVMVSSRVAEAGFGFAFLDLDGRKLFGERQGWVGAYALARDTGLKADEDVLAYAVGFRQGRMTLFAHRMDGTRKALFRDSIKEEYQQEIGLDLAVHNQVAVLSLPLDDQLVFFDLSRRRVRRIATVELPRPKGLMTDSQGRLLVISEQHVERFDVDWSRGRLGRKETLLSAELEDPRRLAQSADGLLYVSDWGRSHQVKVFSPDGRLIRTIGAPGGPQEGPYNERRMHHPNGLALDAEGQLWVAEYDYAPKRLSHWTPQDSLIQAFYGPPRYGGGGVLDPADSTRFYYATVRRLHAGIRFKLDWESRISKPESIYLREPAGTDLGLPFEAPEYPIRAAGRTYLVNTFDQSYRGMRGIVDVWLLNESTQTIRLVSVVGFHGGNAEHRWDELNRADLVAGRPPGIPNRNLFFVWSDFNLDGQVQAAEMQYARSEKGLGRVSVGESLGVLTSWMRQIEAPEMDENGVPHYDLAGWTALSDPPDKIGVGDVLRAGPDWVILAGGPIRGYRQGTLAWSYHSRLFDRADARDLPAGPGDLQETSRVLGPSVIPPEGEAGHVWGLNSDKGSVYLFTADGLFLQRLGGDARIEPGLGHQEVRPGQIVDNFSFEEEQFWPSLTQLDSGSIFLAAGKEYTGLFRVEGFEAVRRIDLGTVVIE
jgi:hypothetical protein